MGREDLAKIRFDEIGYGPDKSRICSTILRQLPDWFGLEFALRDYESNVRSQWFLTALVEGRPVGFLSLEEAFFLVSSSVNRRSFEPSPFP